MGKEMRGTDLYDFYMAMLRDALAKGSSFDVLERAISVGGRDATFFFVDGLTQGDRMQWIMSFLMELDEARMKKVACADDFLKYAMPYHDTIAESDMAMVLKHLYSGMVPLVVRGLEKVIIIDARDYPSRGVEEPSKEKSLRGAKDGFTEGFMTNIALVRRRIRDKNLVFESHVIGSESKTDACLVYMKGAIDQSVVKRLGERLDSIEMKSLGALDQTLVEALLKSDCSYARGGSGGCERGGRSDGAHDEKKSSGGFGKRVRLVFSWLNPFPKVRYTQRPDVVATHVEEGKIAILLDNTPTAILLPACIFDFVQDVDDYYFPPMTGNYFRLLRIMNIFLTVFAVPVYFMMAEEYIPVYSGIRFFVPETDFAVSLFWQFIIIEIAIDALKLASLNTPESLGMSLSVIGALILGEFSVNSGWFIPQTILVMAVVALASFTHPSIELGYAIKFARILILVGAALGGMMGEAVLGSAGEFLVGIFVVNAGSFAIAGAVLATAAVFAVMACTKTLVDTSYLYPLVPFNWQALKKLIFRTAK